jgi:Tol biopolymer transport system component
VSLAAAPAALAQDSLAPKGAEPHWLPDEEWVNLLWLPFDEEDLYRLLRSDRGEVFRWVRIDADHSIAQIARRRGWTVERLARRLAAERSGGAGARTRRVAASRTRRVLTQPHLSQHLLFHALHQTAIGDDARRIFGVRRREDFFDLRRAEVSPLQIGELHGRTRVTMTRRCIEVLRAAASRAVRTGSMSRLQADILLDRQLRQIPRWLGQNRYNGPTGGSNRPKVAPADYANHPGLSADGTKVVWDAYRTTIAEAEQLGEIHVAGWDLEAGRAFGASPPEERGSRRPTSYYNSVLSADGSTVAFESAESTYPLAKRVGQMTVLVRDLRTGRIEKASHLGRPPGARGSRTAFNPTLSADGRLVAFEATDAGSPSRNGVWLYDRATRTQRLLEEERAGAAYLPVLAGDGSAIAYTAPDDAFRTQVYVERLEDGARTVASVAPDGTAAARGDAFDPAITHDGTLVAFVSRARNLPGADGRAHVYLRDLASATTVRISGPEPGDALDPAISADGRYVTWVGRLKPRSATLAGQRSRIWVHDRATGTTRLVSVTPDGRPADGYASQPVAAADGAHVAFTSTSGTLAPGKPFGLPGVFVCDLRTGEVSLVSRHPLRRGGAGGPGSRGGGDHRGDSGAGDSAPDPHAGH